MKTSSKLAKSSSKHWLPIPSAIIVSLAVWGVTVSAQQKAESPAAKPPPVAAKPLPVAVKPSPVAADVKTVVVDVKPVVAEVKPVHVEVEQLVIDYNEAELQSVLRTLATKAGVNLIIGDEITGKVTVHLEGVSYEDAMQLIVESKGYGYVKDKNVVRIKSKDAMENEPLEVRYQNLNFAKAADIATTMGPMLSRRGKIQVDIRSNTLIVSDTSSSLAKIMPLMDKLDTETPQVMIEAKFVETTKNPRKDLGINWSGTLLNHQVTAGGSATSTDPTKPPTVLVDATGTPVSGIQWAKPPGGSMLTPWNAGTALLDAGTAKLVFSFLSQDIDTELLASPRVVTTDNGKAKVAIAQQYPVPNFQFSESSGAFQIAGFTYKDIGIVLTVTPRINKNDYVTMEVTPEASSQAGVATISSGSSSTQIPIIDTRTATTTVLIKSGNTLAIGGLMRQDTSDFYTKVPVMGDLPGIGAMFRSKSLNKTKRDLLIFVTPTIVHPDSKTGFEKPYAGLDSRPVYTNDKWNPTDTAHPNPANLRGVVPFAGSKKAPAQNFGP